MTTSSLLPPNSDGFVANDRTALENFFSSAKRYFAEASGDLSLEYLPLLLGQLDGCSLPHSVKATRAARLLGMLSLSQTQQTALAIAARNWGASPVGSRTPAGVQHKQRRPARRRTSDRRTT